MNKFFEIKKIETYEKSTDHSDTEKPTELKQKYYLSPAKELSQSFWLETSFERGKKFGEYEHAHIDTSFPHLKSSQVERVIDVFLKQNRQRVFVVCYF